MQTTTHKQRLLFVINPISGIGRQKTIETLVPKIIDSNKFEYHFAYTKAPKYATTLARNAAPDYDIIIAVGGDGTINEVANGLFGTNTAMGIIPTGSGNGLARHLNIPLKTKDAIAHINKASIKPTDLVECNGHFFISIAGIGFDALVAHRFATYGKRGFWPYFKIIIRNTFSYKGQNYTITSPTQKFDVKAFMISIANSSQFGFDTRIAPLAEVHDGLFDVTIIKKFSMWHVPSLAWCLLRGRIHTSEQVISMKEASLTIQPHESTQKCEVHFDGDPFHVEPPITAKIHKHALNVLY